MKKLFTTLLLFLCALSINADAVTVVVVGGSSAACATPSTGDTANEGFIGGYEQGICGAAPCWTETPGAGGSVTEDFTLSGTPPTGSCTKGVQVIASQAGSQTVLDMNTTLDTGTVNVNVYFSIYFTTLTIDNLAGVDIFRPDQNTSEPGTVQVKNNSGTYQMRVDASGDSDYATVVTGAWYEVVIHYNTTAASSYFQMTGNGSTACDTVDECGFTRADFDVSHIRVTSGGVGSGEYLTYEIGYLYIDTP